MGIKRTELFIHTPEFVTSNKNLLQKTLNSRYSLARSARLLSLCQDKELQCEEETKTKVD